MNTGRQEGSGLSWMLDHQAFKGLNCNVGIVPVVAAVIPAICVAPAVPRIPSVVPPAVAPAAPPSVYVPLALWSTQPPCFSKSLHLSGSHDEGVPRTADLRYSD